MVTASPRYVTPDRSVGGEPSPSLQVGGLEELLRQISQSPKPRVFSPTGRIRPLSTGHRHTSPYIAHGVEQPQSGDIGDQSGLLQMTQEGRQAMPSRVHCVYCFAQGFHGEHELRRHIEQQHTQYQRGGRGAAARARGY